MITGIALCRGSHWIRNEFWGKLALSLTIIGVVIGALALVGQSAQWLKASTNIRSAMLIGGSIVVGAAGIDLIGVTGLLILKRINSSPPPDAGAAAAAAGSASPPAAAPASGAAAPVEGKAPAPERKALVVYNRENEPVGLLDITPDPLSKMNQEINRCGFVTDYCYVLKISNGQQIHIVIQDPSIKPRIKAYSSLPTNLNIKQYTALGIDDFEQLSVEPLPPPT